MNMRVAGCRPVTVTFCWVEFTVVVNRLLSQRETVTKAHTQNSTLHFIQLNMKIYLAVIRRPDGTVNLKIRSYLSPHHCPEGDWSSDQIVIFGNCRWNSFTGFFISSWILEGGLWTLKDRRRKNDSLFAKRVMFQNFKGLFISMINYWGKYKKSMYINQKHVIEIHGTLTGIKIDI